MKIAYLGPIGSFSQIAVKAAFPTAELLSMDTIADCVATFDAEKCDFALIPIENSIEGTVNLAVDTLFHKSQATVVAEFVLEISQNLLTAQKNQQIERIYSHPQALAQSREFLREHYPEAQLIAVDSTAQAAEFVKKHAGEPVAAVANLEAAAIYDLEILAQNIQDAEMNNTRFWLLGRSFPEVPLVKIGQKVSLALTLPENIPGALHKAISSFAWRGIDMTKIESRPLKTRLGQYFFIIDLVADSKIVFALEELKSLGITARVLGQYNIYEV